MPYGQHSVHFSITTMYVCITAAFGGGFQEHLLYAVVMVEVFLTPMATDLFAGVSYNTHILI